MPARRREYGNVRQATALLLLTLLACTGACTSHPDVTWRETVVTPQPPAAPRLQAVVGQPSSVEVTWIANEVADEVTSYTIVGASTDWSDWNASLPDAIAVTTGACCSIV